MLLLFAGALIVIALAAFGLLFLLKIRSLQAAAADRAVSLSADRYRPMLRLLSDDDLAIVSADSRLKSKLRAGRRELFRGYLRCLARDYALLLAGVRLAIVHSGVDRPDLTKALAKNRIRFAFAMCKVEFRLAMHAAGVGRVDISGLVEALETLRAQVSVLSSPALSTATQAV